MRLSQQAASSALGSAAFVVEMGRFFAKTGTRSALSAGIAGAICGTMPTLPMQYVTNRSVRRTVDGFPRNRVRASRDSPKGLSERSLLYPWFEQQTEFSATLCRHMSRAGFGLRIYGRHGVVGKPPRVHRTSCSVLHRFSAGAALLALTAIPLKLDFNHLLYKVGHPLMAIGFLLLYAVSRATRRSAAFIFTGYCYVYIIMTCLNAHFLPRFGMFARMDCSADFFSGRWPNSGSPV